MLFLPIFIILSDTEESTTIFLDFYHFRVQRWLNRFVYIKTNCSCCPLNCSRVAAKSPICRSHNTLSSCSTSTSPSAATTSMSGRKQPGAWPCLPAARPCPTPGQQFCLLENSKILILTASVKLKDKHLFSKHREIAKSCPEKSHQFLSQFEFCHNLSFEFSHKLKLLVLSQFEFLSCKSFGFWVLSQFEF